MEEMKAKYWSESVVEASLIGPAGETRISGELTFVCEVTSGTERVFGCGETAVLYVVVVGREVSEGRVECEREFGWAREGAQEYGRPDSPSLARSLHAMPCLAIPGLPPKSCYMLRRLHLTPSQPISMRRCGSPHRNH